MCLHLLCHSRELEDVESLVIHGGTLVDVDDHAGFSSSTEEALQVVGQLTLPEGNVLKQPEEDDSLVVIDICAFSTVCAATLMKLN